MFTAAGSYEYKETDSVNYSAVVSEVSSFVGNPVDVGCKIAS